MFDFGVARLKPLQLGTADDPILPGFSALWFADRASDIGWELDFLCDCSVVVRRADGSRQALLVCERHLAQVVLILDAA